MDYQKLINEHRLSVNSAESKLPDMHDKVGDEKKYNPKSHKKIETSRVVTDSEMAKVVEKMQDRIKWMEVKREGNKLILIYIPIQEELSIPGVKWTDIPAIEGKKALYKNASGGYVIWKFRGITGDLNLFFNAKLRTEWYNNAKYKQQSVQFCKHVANIMRIYVHDKCDVFSKLINTFMIGFKRIEKDKEMHKVILDNLIDSLKYVLFDKWKPYINDKRKLLVEIGKVKTGYKISVCSKKCTELLLDLDFEAENANNELLNMFDEGEQIEAERQRILNGEDENIIQDDPPVHEPEKSNEENNTNKNSKKRTITKAELENVEKQLDDELLGESSLKKQKLN